MKTVSYLNNSGVNVKALETEAFEIEFDIADSLTEVLIVGSITVSTARKDRQGSGRQVPDGNVDKSMGRRRRVMAHEKELEKLRRLSILDKQRDTNLRREGHSFLARTKLKKRRGSKTSNSHQ
jgi:hypothetical protein